VAKDYNALLRGGFYGAIQQPRDVIAALYASQLGDDSGDYKSYLDQAKQQSLSGSQGQALSDSPNYFNAGQTIGNIAATAVPAGWATKGIGAAGAAAGNMPRIAATLNALSKGTGITGTLGKGAIEGAVSTGITEGDPLSGAAAGSIGSGIFGLGGKLVKPIAKGSISTARKGFNKVLEKAGVQNLSPGQLTGNNALQTMESVLANLPFTAGAAAKKAEGQLRQFTKEALSKAGIVSDDFSPTVRKQAEEGFQNTYKSLINNETVNIDDDVMKTVANVSANQIEKLPVNIKPVVQSYLKDIVEAGGKMTGEAYQTARSQLTSQAKSLYNTDPFTANVLKTIRNSLDDAAERSLPDSKKGAWREVNRQYANYKTLQKAGSKVSSDSLEGLISPSALLNAVETANKTKSQAGYGDLYDLARAGRGVLTDTVPDSGTAQRLLYQQLATGGALGSAVGTGSVLAGQSPEDSARNALAAVTTAYALPKLIQKGLYSDAAQTYFTKGIPYLNRAVGNSGSIDNVLSAQMSTPRLEPQYDPENDPVLQQMIGATAQPQSAPYNPDNDPELQKLLMNRGVK